MRRAVHTLRSSVGRVQRDVARQLGELPEQAQAKVNVISKTEKRRIKKEKKIQRELERPESLAELRKIAKRKTQNGIR